MAVRMKSPSRSDENIQLAKQSHGKEPIEVSMLALGESAERVSREALELSVHVEPSVSELVSKASLSSARRVSEQVKTIVLPHKEGSLIFLLSICFKKDTKKPSKKWEWVLLE